MCILFCLCITLYISSILVFIPPNYCIFMKIIIENYNTGTSSVEFGETGIENI